MMQFKNLEKQKQIKSKRWQEIIKIWAEINETKINNTKNQWILELVTDKQDWESFRITGMHHHAQLSSVLYTVSAHAVSDQHLF